MIKLTQFCNVQRALRKIRVLKIKAKAFEPGKFLKIFLSFLEFLRLIFLQKVLYKKHVVQKPDTDGA